MQVKQKDADCIGNGLVDKVGTEQLQKYGLLTKDLKLNKDVTTVKMSPGRRRGRGGHVLRAAPT